MRRTVRPAVLLTVACAVGGGLPPVAYASDGPRFGPNVIVFDSASGGILSVINGKGGSPTVANRDTPVVVPSYS